MKQYLDLMKHIWVHGIEKSDRTGTGTLSLFGYQMRFDLAKGFPLLTTKKMWLKGIIYELLWMLKGDTNIKYLNDNGVHIWDKWADEKGKLGPVYGQQWRSWFDGYDETFDQILHVAKRLRNDPDSRRHIVSAWNVADLRYMKLPPCHCLFQFDVTEGKLSCHLYQRSADIVIGLPYNIASYALLTMMMAQACGLDLGEFIHTLGNAHIYLNHLEQVETQLGRLPYPLPTMQLNPEVDDIFSFTFDDFTLLDYQHHAAIKAPVAV